MDVQPPTTRRRCNGAECLLDIDNALERAKKMLLDDYLVQVVAEAVGYSSSSAFSTAFRARVKMTPSAWYAANTG